MYLQPLKANDVGGYAEASRVRIQHGHDAATPLYRQLLQQNSQDTSAATRIAASKHSLKDLGRVGWPYDLASSHYRWEEDIAKLRSILDLSHYNHSSIREHIFNLPTGIDEGVDDSDGQSLERHKNEYPFGPTYIRPLAAGQSLDPSSVIGSQTTAPDGDGWLRSLQCLTTLFLLSSCVPNQLFVESVIGGEETLELFQRLSIIFIEEEWAVPLVHLFPLDIPPMRSMSSDAYGKSLVLTTDLHPTVLGVTSIPQLVADSSSTQEEGAVMYIGPDSLALVHHLHASMPRFLEGQNEINRILDVCTGSGVQALATLAMLESLPCSGMQPIAIAVDINERALRFTDFNTRLNGCDGKVITVHADLLSGKAYPRRDLQQPGELRGNNCSLVDELLKTLGQNGKETKFDLFLANPPFIPVPPSRSDDPALSIREERSCVDASTPRYGLFSSGGATGEDCLAAIVQMAPALLNPDGGLLAIVSEFMNPPSSNDSLDNELLSKIGAWWGQQSAGAEGMLFTNEFAVSSETYALRRAMTNDQEDTKLWEDHLRQSGIQSVSPGLLFVQTKPNENEGLALKHKLVPKSQSGSVWTPHNVAAVQFTKDTLWEIV